MFNIFQSNQTNYENLTKTELKEIFTKLEYEYYCEKHPSQLRRIKKELKKVEKRLIELKKAELNKNEIKSRR